MENKVKSIMAKVFNISASDINDEASAHTIGSWDSLKHMDLVLSLENEFNIKLDNEEIPTMINYRMVVDTVESHME